MGVDLMILPKAETFTNPAGSLRAALAAFSNALRVGREAAADFDELMFTPVDALERLKRDMQTYNDAGSQIPAVMAELFVVRKQLALTYISREKHKRRSSGRARIDRRMVRLTNKALVLENAMPVGGGA